MKLAIIESPYSGNVQRNVSYARRCVADSLRRNEAPIASHLLHTQPGILNDEVLQERLLGIRAGWAWLCVADIHAFYTDLGWSQGMIDALRFTRRNKFNLLQISYRALYGQVREPPEEN